MNFKEQTQQQLERALRKLAEKFPAEQEATMLSDIHFRVSQDTGEVTILDDDDREAVAELYVVDGDTVIVDPDLMEGLDKDLDDFLENLLKS